MKDETRKPGYQPVEIGKFSSSDRSDLTTMYNMAVKGRTERDIAMSFPASYMRYYKGVKQIKSLYMPEREDAPQVVLIHGPPGTGKTYSVIKQVEDLWKSSPKDGLEWFDGFDSHENVLLDEFAGKMSKVSLSYLLALIDRYTQRVPTKGSFTMWAPKTIYITTNYHPTKWYDWSERTEQWFALVRRFTHVLQFSLDREPKAYYRGSGSTPSEWNMDWRKWWNHPTQQLFIEDNDKTQGPSRTTRSRKAFDLSSLFKKEQRSIIAGQRLMAKYLHPETSEIIKKMGATQ